MTQPPKPKMRGVFHSYGAAVALALGTLLVVEAPDNIARFGCAVYTFAVSPHQCLDCRAASRACVQLQPQLALPPTACLRLRLLAAL